MHILNNNRAACAAELLGLESLGWIDNLTRSLAVEISTFTPGSNIFSTLTLVWPHCTGDLMAISFYAPTGDGDAFRQQRVGVVIHLHFASVPLHNHF